MCTYVVHMIILVLLINFVFVLPPGDTSLDCELWMFNQEALQEYILYCCQSPHGGLIDKPGK